MDEADEVKEEHVYHRKVFFRNTIYPKTKMTNAMGGNSGLKESVIHGSAAPLALLFTLL